MRDKRFIIIKINSHYIAYSIIDGSSMTFYDNSGNITRKIDLSMMLRNIVDIPLYFKMLFERGTDAISYVSESESFELYEFMQFENPYMPIPPNIERWPNSEVLDVFELGNDGMTFTIEIVPQPSKIYYNFTIETNNRLIMDILVDPVDLLYVDAEKECIHTMEQGHEELPFEAKEVIKFIHPELAYRVMNNHAPNKHVIII